MGKGVKEEFHATNFLISTLIPSICLETAVLQRRIQRLRKDVTNSPQITTQGKTTVPQAR